MADAGLSFPEKKLAYFSLLLVAIPAAAAISALAYFFNIHTAGHTFYQAAIRRLFPSIFLVLASASLGAFRDNFRLEKEKEERETEHLRTELSFLRTQINPHFMLNVLNSMVLMARKRSELLEPALLELAGLMNYILYNTDQEKIRLEEEIEYLRVYVDLQMLRFRGDVQVEFNHSSDTGDWYIEPMLLIPLVENAFKHGIGLVNAPVIIIDIAIAEPEMLRVTVKNKYNRQNQEHVKKGAGIGLINLRKRLDLIYPETYRMDVMTSHLTDPALTENWYIVSLNIPLE